MTDRKKVIAALSECNPFNQCYEERCPYYKDNNCLELLHEHALKLLKEQEPMLLENQHKPFGYNTNANSPWISRCPKCNKKVEGKQTKFCKYCGQAVKWDERN